MAYAALLVEGFDHTTGLDLFVKWQSGSGTPTISAGRIRGSAMAFGGYVRQYLDHLNAGTAFYDHVVFGVAYRTPNVLVGTVVVALDSGVASTGAGAFDLILNATGTLSLRRNATVIATGASVLAPATWYYLEVKVLIATTAVGSYELRINGVTELGPTSSVQTSSSTVNVLRLSNGGGTSAQYDDLVTQDWSVAGVDFLGDVSVATLFPSGAGNSTQFTPSASTNNTNVDDATADGDTTYNSDATVSDRDDFAMDNLPTNGTPYIVQVTTEARKDDAGSRTMRNYVRTSATNYDGTTKSLTDSYLFHQDVWNSDPSGGAWDQTKVDALNAGYKVQA
jgi:hypothetical protein